MLSLKWLLFRQRIAYFLAGVYVRATNPWILARFYAAWEEYRTSQNYRERLLGLGLEQTIYMFLDSKWERKYCLKLRFQKEPRLKWKLLLAPYSFTAPQDLEIASRQGYFG